MMPQEENVTPKNATSPDSVDAEETPNFRGLKVLVILLGIGIAGMLALITYTISQRAAETLSGDEPATATVTAPAEAALYLENHLVERPTGATLLSVTVNGPELVLHFEGEAGDTIVTLDRRTGKQTRIEIPGKWIQN